MEDDFILFSKWKTTSIISSNRRRPLKNSKLQLKDKIKNQKMENDIRVFKWKTLDNLKYDA